MSSFVKSELQSESECPVEVPSGTVTLQYEEVEKKKEEMKGEEKTARIECKRGLSPRRLCG